MDVLGGLGNGFSFSGAPCSHEHEGTAQGPCSPTILRLNYQSFIPQRLPFLKLLSRGPCAQRPAGPAYSPAMPGPARLLASSAQRRVDRQDSVLEKPARPTLTRQILEHSLLGQSEFKRRCGPFHPSSDTYQTPSHPVIALKVSSVGVASAKKSSKFSVGETESQQDHKPDKEQRREKKKAGGN